MKCFTDSVIIVRLHRAKTFTPLLIKTEKFRNSFVIMISTAVVNYVLHINCCRWHWTL